MNRALRLFPISLVLVAGLSVVGCGSGGDTVPAADEQVRIPVRVVSPTMSRAMPPIVLTGTLAAKEEIPLSFKIGGVVARVLVDVGQSVRAGDVLAELSLTEIDAQVSTAREGRDKARRDLARAEALFADSVVTRSQHEDARTQLDVAEAQLKGAEFNRQYAVVRAPANGLVLRRQLEAGQVVGSGTPVLILRTDRKGLVLRASAADRDAVRLEEGVGALVEFDAFPEQVFEAQVERVGVAASPQTGTYEVEISVVPSGGRLVSGLIGKVTILPRSSSALPMIPATAMLEVDGSSATIFVLNEAGDAVRRVSVRVAFLDGDLAAISEGLTADARVVTAGVTRLADGTKVTVAAERTP